MKTLPITRPVLALLIACLPLRAEDEVEKAFRDALYAEEVKGDTEAALKAYQEVAAKFEQQRDMAATALFRQAECLRKLGRKDEAAALYNKVLAQYGDKERTAKLSRENLAALGMAPAAGGDTPAAATDTGEVARLEKLLKDSPDLINATDASNPLAAAAEKGQVALVDYLLGKGARVDTLVDGKSALHRAAEAGHLTVCQKLIEKGADVNLNSSAEATPLILALDKGRFSIVELLLEKKADAKAGKLYSFNPGKSQPISIGNGLQSVQTDPRTSETHYTLTLALERKAPVPLVLRLIEAGADPAARYRSENSKDDGQNKDIAPLGFAIRGRQLEVIAAILAKGYSPNQSVDGKAWAMDLAMEEAKPSAPEAADDPLVELLLKHGAELKREDVMLAAVQKGLTGYIRAAAKDGAGVNLLAEAAYSRQAASVRTLIELGADPTAHKENWSDAMHASISESNAEIIELLRKAGYPVKEKLAGLVKNAAWEAFPDQNREPLKPEARAIYDRLAAEAKEAGVLEEGLTSALDATLNYGSPPVKITALLEQGANAAKSEALRAKFNNKQNSYGVFMPEYPLLWRHANILQNPDLKTAVWASRGPSVIPLAGGGGNVFYNANTQHFQPFFRAVIPGNGIVPAETMGRFVASYGADLAKDDLAHLTVYRLDQDRKLQELKVDFVAIATAGDSAKDFALQWGDVVEIPPRENSAREADQVAVSKFIEAIASRTDISFSIGEDQIITNADNGMGPVLRMKEKGNPLWTAGLAQTEDGSFRLEVRRPGEKDFQRMDFYQLFHPGHGCRVRITPPAKEPALNDGALRSAVTLAVSESGPFLRVGLGVAVDLTASDPFGSSQDHAPALPRLRDVLLKLHGPNAYGFGPVDWSAAKLKVAKGDGWEVIEMSKALLDGPLAAGTILILPPLDPAKPVPADTFDYAACAMEVEVTPGDLPPFKLRFQPPVPELKRSGDKWVWSWKRKDGDSPCAWPDLYTLLAEAPQLKDWGNYTGKATLASGVEYGFDKGKISQGAGLWLQPDWKGIRLERQTNQGAPAGIPIPASSIPGGVLQPQIPQAAPVPTVPNPPGRSRIRVVNPTNP